MELDPPVGPTVDDLASAWSDLPAFDSTAPIDVTVDGFDGKMVEFTVPDYDVRSRSTPRSSVHNVAGGGNWFGSLIGAGRGDTVIFQALEAADPNTTVGARTRVWAAAVCRAGAQRGPNSRDQPAVIAVNLYAPYILTALVVRPQRLIYLSSDMHTSGSADDLDWTARTWDGTQAYCDSKLFATTLAFAISRRWPDVRSNAADPGWVPTRMGGPSATDALTLGHRTQVWLATSDDPAAALSGRYWYRQRSRRAAGVTVDDHVQRRLIDQLHDATGIALA